MKIKATILNVENGNMEEYIINQDEFELILDDKKYKIIALEFKTQKDIFQRNEHITNTINSWKKNT